MDDPTGRIGLMIAGGGCPQLENAVGCIKAIKQIDNINIDEVWGVSAGAVAGSIFMSMKQDIDEFEDLIIKTPITNWFTLSPWQAIKSLWGKSNHVADNTGLKQALDKYVDPSTYDKVKVSISEMEDGKFKRTLVVDGRPSHVLASMSFQHVFPPVKINGKIYGDGGVNDNIPLPRYVDIPKYKHLYLILAPSAPLLPSVPRWTFLDRVLRLMDDTMNRELAQVEQLHLEDLRNVTVIKPEKWEDSASFLGWSDEFIQISKSFDYATKVLTEKKNATMATFPMLP